MASLLNAVPNAKLTATRPRTYDQVAAEPEAGFPGAEALCGGKSDLTPRLGRGFWVLFCRKKVPEEITKSI